MHIDVQVLTVPYEVAAPPVEAINQPGDVWILAIVLLVCGDS